MALVFFVSCLVGKIMGSVCSKIPNQSEITENMHMKAQEQSELADLTVPANVDKSRVAIYEPDCFPPKVVPSYSWLISSPVDFDATAKEVNEKAEEAKEFASENTNEIKYCNRRFVKYCQHSATALPLSPNTKQRT